MLRVTFGVLALATLFACLTLPMLHFQGRLDNQTYKHYFLIASALWFVCAIPWAVLGKPKPSA
jgi:hypothetical protein